ncbi:unnamed protein product [Rodentolepis nana]|uniref:GOLD domain-containing protein n=1 Tax=Rodentolepis nana TaxID=102285 RepID=A0A0R3T4H2_RODNA|nr:unnamed protein product [Rodentolepis nana]
MSGNAVETDTLDSQVVKFPPNGQNVETNQPDAEQETDISSENPPEEEERRQHEAALRSILEQQCIIQFRKYAQEQYPKDIAKQDESVRNMQDQYFAYYMEDVQRSQMINQQNQIDQLIELREASRLNSNGANEDDDLGEPIPLPLVPASMWTRKDIADFKKDILANHRECCIKISSLASATLRVPTHAEGTSIVWEFATDSYDLGFGLYFEWNLTPQENITMTISESSDEEDEGEDEDEGEASGENPFSSAPPTPRPSGPPG